MWYNLLLASVGFIWVIGSSSRYKFDIQGVLFVPSGSYHLVGICWFKAKPCVARVIRGTWTDILHDPLLTWRWLGPVVAASFHVDFCCHPLVLLVAHNVDLFSRYCNPGLVTAPLLLELVGIWLASHPVELDLSRMTIWSVIWVPLVVIACEWNPFVPWAVALIVDGLHLERLAVKRVWIPWGGVFTVSILLQGVKQHSARFSFRRLFSVEARPNVHILKLFEEATTSAG